MVHIITDSSTLYTIDSAKEKGIGLCPLMVTIDDHSYQDLIEMTSTQLLKEIENHKIPKTSQPSIGHKIDLYNELVQTGEVIDITMTSGLSGTYESALMAKESCDHPELVHVIDSKTLCGPHRLIVDTALAMAKADKSAKDIVKMIVTARETDTSFLVPLDFQFLARGGRVNGLSAALGGALKLIPVMKKEEQGISKFGVCRTYKKVVETILKEMKEHGANEDYTYYISHAFNDDLALRFEKRFKEEFPKAKVVVLPLSPAFIAQGGPGCVAVQSIYVKEDA